MRTPCPSTPGRGCTPALCRPKPGLADDDVRVLVAFAAVTAVAAIWLVALGDGYRRGLGEADGEFHNAVGRRREHVIEVLFGLLDCGMRRRGPGEKINVSALRASSFVRRMRIEM